jgi:excinuclease ABC subunit C
LLDDIEGVGAKRRKALYDHFGTFEKIKKANIDELVQVPGISRALAAKIIETLHRSS